MNKTAKGVIFLAASIILTMPFLTYALTSSEEVKVIEPYQEGQILINKEGYTLKEVLSLPYGSGEKEVRLEEDGLRYGLSYLFVDEKGNIYISDDCNNKILKFDKNGKFLLSFFSQWGGYCLWVDKDENVYTILPDQIFKYSPKGKILERIKSSVPLETRRKIGDPSRVVIDNQGKMYLHLEDYHSEIENLSQPSQERDTRYNTLTKQREEYPYLQRTAELGEVVPGHLSQYFDKSYSLGKDADRTKIVIRNKEGQKLSEINTKAGEKSGIISDKTVSIYSIIGDDKAGNIYVWGCVYGTGMENYVILKFDPTGSSLLQKSFLIILPTLNRALFL